MSLKQSKPVPKNFYTLKPKQVEIIAYIILSYMLSAVGYGIYHFGVRKRSSAAQQKWIIYAVLGLSLLLPLGFIHSDPLFYTEKAHTNIKFHDEPVLTKELLACYARSKSQDNFCHCEQQQQLNLVQFQKNSYYDTYLNYQPIFTRIAFGIGAIVIIILSLKLFQLWQFIHQSKKEIRTIDGKNYTFLITHKNLLAASFRLWKSYIIWHPNLNELSKKEQNAIIQHEIAHLNHKDTWEQIGLTFLQIVWFINPIFYYIKKDLNLINEYLADAFAVQKTGDVKTYANLILKLKANQQFGFVHQIAQHPIEARIVQLFEPQPKKSLFPIWLLLVGLFMVTTVWKTAPLVNNQYTDFEEYCHLQKEYHNSGRQLFCKNCLFEDLN
jgi:Zn-dependent protease with chaperone function